MDAFFLAKKNASIFLRAQTKFSHRTFLNQLYSSRSIDSACFKNIISSENYLQMLPNMMILSQNQQFSTNSTEIAKKKHSAIRWKTITTHQNAVETRSFRDGIHPTISLTQIGGILWTKPHYLVVLCRVVGKIVTLLFNGPYSQQWINITLLPGHECEVGGNLAPQKHLFHNKHRIT